MGIMNKNREMYNMKKLIKQEVQKVLSIDTLGIDFENFDSIKSQNYANLGIDYWNWIDFIANLETTFSKDLTETSEKFKIETIEQVIDALYSAPNITNLYNN